MDLLVNSQLRSKECILDECALCIAFWLWNLNRLTHKFCWSSKKLTLKFIWKKCKSWFRALLAPWRLIFWEKKLCFVMEILEEDKILHSSSWQNIIIYIFAKPHNLELMLLLFVQKRFDESDYLPWSFTSCKNTYTKWTPWRYLFAR